MAIDPSARIIATGGPRRPESDRSEPTSAALDSTDRPRTSTPAGRSMPSSAGDRDAFRFLVERESASVVRACHRVLGDLHEAEDAAQEAFVIAYRSLAGWRGDGSFGAWLGRIAVRNAIRRAKARRSVARIDPTDPDLVLGSGPGDAMAGADRASLAAMALGPERARPTRP